MHDAPRDRDYAINTQTSAQNSTKKPYTIHPWHLTLHRLSE
ncbi:hypothetical protein [Candidatus Sarmatiella mevalonica]|nr:hypothetical protein [Candidatus Sarmatiella mevalonica]